MDVMVLDAILNGWKLFPAFWDKKNSRHVSYIKWGSESSSDPKIIEDWVHKWPKCHLCVNLSASDLTVLDVDMKHGIDGGENLKNLEKEFGPINPTLTASTPSGGLHYYFTGAVQNTVGKLAKGLDTPVMVPLAGQTVTGKGEYRVIKSLDLAETPKWIIEKVGLKSFEPPKIGSPVNVELNQPHNIMKATALALTDDPILLGSKTTTIYKMACEIRDLAIDKDNCIAILLAANIKRCQPPMAEEKISYIASCAYQYAKGQLGSATPEADFADVPILPAPPKEKIIPQGIFRLTDFAGAAPERKWIVEDWLPEGELVALYGPPGSGKSLIALQLSLSIASGSKWLGLNSSQLPVLLVACEDNADELHRRVEAVKNDPAHSFIFDNKSTLDNWYGWPRVGFDNALAHSDSSGNRLVQGGFWDELCEQIKLMPEGSKLIILDTIADIFAGNENDRTAVNAFLKTVLGKLRVEFDATVLIVGHPAKSENSQYSGSTAWDGGVRSRWYMSRYDNDKPSLQNYRVLSRAKANYSSINGDDTKIILQWQNGSFIPSVEADIIDITLEKESMMVYNVIAEEAETGVRLNTHASAAKCIYRWPRLKDSYGKQMTRKRIDECLAKLTCDCLIEKTRGANYNGFAPTFAGNTEEDYRKIDAEIRGNNGNHS